MQFRYPFYFDGRRRPAAVDDEDHVRDMIEQYLLTNPGERVNRPDFGCGLMQLIHGLNSPELAAALQFTAQAGLQRWLGDLIELNALDVSAFEGELRIAIGYTVRRSGVTRSVLIRRGLP